MKKNKLNVVPYDASLQKLAFGFDSGNDYLDRFLKSAVALDDNFGKTYVYLSNDGEFIIGYYNIGVGYIEQVAAGAPRKMGGSVHINCFALDKRFHGRLQVKTSKGTAIYLSDMLLQHCIDQVYELREKIGFTFITLCSTRQGYSLYVRNNFYDLEEDMSFSVEEEAAFSSESEDDFCAYMYLPLDFE